MRNIFSIQAGHAGPTGFQIAPFNRSQTAPWSKYQKMIKCFKSKGSLPYHLGSLIKLLCGQYELGDHYIYIYVCITITYYNQFQPLQQQPSQVQSSSLSTNTVIAAIRSFWSILCSSCRAVLCAQLMAP